MFGSFSLLKACNVSVAASGVFFYDGKLIVWLTRGPGRPKYMCEMILVLFGIHFEVKYL